MPPETEHDRSILERIDQKTQALYNAVVGTLDEPGIQERIRDHDRRLVVLEARNAGLANRLITLLTSILTALASTWAYIKLQGHH